jgi:hypothetical protein
MGKLTEILHRAGVTRSGAIGFTGHTANAAKSKAAAIIVSAADATEAAALIKAGADVVILAEGADLQAAKGSEVAWGSDVRGAKSLAEDDLKALHERGADFVLVDASASMRSLSTHVEQLDRALFLAPPTDDPLLIGFRALNVLDVDVVVLDLALKAKELAGLTVKDFARLRLLGESLRFPVLVTLADVPAPEDVRTAARLGDGIWLTSATPDAVTKLREELERVPREKGPVPGIAGLTGTTGGAPGPR